MPNASGLAAVRMNDLKKDQYHSVRIVAPMTDNGGKGVFQLDGLWLDQGGQLYPVEGSIADTISEEMDAFDAEGNVAIGAQHRLRFSELLRGHGSQDTTLLQTAEAPASQDDGQPQEFKRRKKLVEIVTDDPANFRGKKLRGERSGGTDGLLAGVMGWEYLVGEMFSVDHVCIGVEGMCLLHNCAGGTGSPSGLGDVFFRRYALGDLPDSKRAANNVKWSCRFTSLWPSLAIPIVRPRRPGMSNANPKLYNL